MNDLNHRLRNLRALEMDSARAEAARRSTRSLLQMRLDERRGLRAQAGLARRLRRIDAVFGIEGSLTNYFRSVLKGLHW